MQWTPPPSMQCNQIIFIFAVISEMDEASAEMFYHHRTVLLSFTALQLLLQLLSVTKNTKKKTHFKVSCATQIVKHERVAWQRSIAKKRAGDTLHVHINNTQKQLNNFQQLQSLVNILLVIYKATLIHARSFCKHCDSVCVSCLNCVIC